MYIWCIYMYITGVCRCKYGHIRHTHLPEAVPEGDVQCRYGVDITPALPEVTSRGVPINQSIKDAQDGVERRRYI